MRKHDTRTHTLKDGTLTGKSARAVRCEKVAAAAARYKSKTKNKIKNKIKNKNNRRRNKTKNKTKKKNKQNTHVRKHGTRKHIQRRHSDSKSAQYDARKQQRSNALQKQKKIKKTKTKNPDKINEGVSKNVEFDKKKLYF